MSRGDGAGRASTKENTKVRPAAVQVPATGRDIDGAPPPCRIALEKSTLTGVSEAMLVVPGPGVVATTDKGTALVLAPLVLQRRCRLQPGEGCARGDAAARGTRSPSWCCGGRARTSLTP